MSRVIETTLAGENNGVNKITRIFSVEGEKRGKDRFKPGGTENREKKQRRL